MQDKIKFLIHTFTLDSDLDESAFRGFSRDEIEQIHQRTRVPNNDMNSSQFVQETIHNITTRTEPPKAGSSHGSNIPVVLDSNQTYCSGPFHMPQNQRKRKTQTELLQEQTDRYTK